MPRPPVCSYTYIPTVYCVDQCFSATLPTVYLYLEAALIGESFYIVLYLFFRSLVDSISFDNFTSPNLNFIECCI